MLICFNESSLKMMKNAFYLILKALFVLTFRFLLGRFGHVKSVIINIWLVSKCVTSQPGKQKIAISILPNILQSEGSQAMKFGQLIKYNKINIFLQKSCKNQIGH